MEFKQVVTAILRVEFHTDAFCFNTQMDRYCNNQTFIDSFGKMAHFRLGKWRVSVGPSFLEILGSSCQPRDSRCRYRGAPGRRFLWFLCRPRSIGQATLSLKCFPPACTALRPPAVSRGVGHRHAAVSGGAFASGGLSVCPSVRKRTLPPVLRYAPGAAHGVANTGGKPSGQA